MVNCCQVFLKRCTRKWHATVCNVIFKRLQNAAKEEAAGGVPELRQLRSDLQADVQRLPLDARVAPRSSSETQLDLSQAKLFMHDRKYRDR